MVAEGDGTDDGGTIVAGGDGSGDNDGSAEVDGSGGGAG